MASHAQRQAVFASNKNLEAFEGILGRQHIYRPDPFDANEIHSEARRKFSELLDQVSAEDSPDMGKILVILGDSGSGKTHLMRAFRQLVHKDEKGYFGYLELTAMARDYNKYLLSGLIDSLGYPYFAGTDDRSGLRRLSDAFAERPSTMKWPVKRPKHDRDSALRALRDWAMNDTESIRFVELLADAIVQKSEWRHLNMDPELVRALLFLQRDDARYKNAVVRYLRGDALSELDAKRLGGINARSNPEDVQLLLRQLGQIAWAADESCVVLCADQLDSIHFNAPSQDEAVRLFRQAIGAITDFVNHVPRSVVIVASVAEIYEQYRETLHGPLRDRLEVYDPIYLRRSRDADEIEAILARRLEWLYTVNGADPDPGNAIWPFDRLAVEQLSGQITRRVLRHAYEFRAACARAGSIVEQSDIGGDSPEPPSGPLFESWDAAWSAFVADSDVILSDDEIESAKLVADALVQSKTERDDLAELQVEGGSRYIDVTLKERTCLPVICDRGSQGGGLLNQLRAAKDNAEGKTLVILRSTEFPSHPRAVTAKELGKMIAAGHIRHVVEHPEWRQMACIDAFHEQHKANVDYQAWRRAVRPISSLRTMQIILGCLLDEPDEPAEAEPPVLTAPSFTPRPPTEETAVLTGPKHERQPAPTDDVDTPSAATAPHEIAIGHETGIARTPFNLQVQALTRHAAFLGSTGSGKTTAAMRVIEQLLLRGVPAIFIDRKGDLVNYAMDESGGEAAQLRERLAVTVYTPGNSQGRSLAVQLLPSGMEDMDTSERGRLAGYCAANICGMLGLRGNPAEMSRAILKAAIEVLVQAKPAQEVRVGDLIQLIDDRDPSLTSQLSAMSDNQFKKLGEYLTAMSINRAHLFADDGEPQLDLPNMLSPRSDGRTPLTIISTKFLGGESDAEFWVAQFIVALGRWVSRNPSPKLQAIVFFDEADIWLPAQKKPATKEPLEDLLRRARSGGLGVVLATQNPGDFDYKSRGNIHTWFIGKVHGVSAVEKVKPLLDGLPGDVAHQLANLETGQFYVVHENRSRRVAVDRNLIQATQQPEDTILRIAHGES
jgi:Cdc6-like AAA superfamily ATPase